MSHSDDQPNSFAALIGKIEPIKSSKTVKDFGRQPKIRQKRRIEAQNIRPATRTYSSQIAECYDLLSPHEWNAMQSGRVFIERILDFHGYFVDEALRALDDALIERRNRRPIYWQIIHGKGRNTQNETISPLKVFIIEHLRIHSAISALVSIQDSRGESGAVLVRLRPREKH